VIDVFCLAVAVTPSLDLEVAVHRLDNGLTLILQPDPHERSVALSVRHPVGSMHDPRGRAGIAHLIEHLMFHETKGSPSGDFVARLEAAGGARVNAFTAYDHTEYVAVVPPDALRLALELEADRISGAADGVRPERVEREKRVVENELYERLYDDPYAFIDRLLFESLFPNEHPLHSGPIGTVEEIDAIGHGDVVRFLRENYGPNGAVVVIAGRIDPDLAYGSAVETLGALRPITRGSRTAPTPAVRPLKSIHGPSWVGVRPQLTLLWPVGDGGATEELEVIGAMLSHARVSRAALANMKDESIEALDASVMRTPGGTFFRVDAIVASGLDSQLARHRVSGMIETYVTVAPLEPELVGAKRRMRYELERALGSIATRASILQNVHAELGDAKAYADVSKRWDRVTSAGIQQVLADMMTAEPIVAVAHPVRR
jgi:predicted Zn-dependent peptidase